MHSNCSRPLDSWRKFSAVRELRTGAQSLHSLKVLCSRVTFGILVQLYSLDDLQTRCKDLGISHIVLLTERIVYEHSTVRVRSLEKDKVVDKSVRIVVPYMTM